MARYTHRIINGQPVVRQTRAKTSIAEKLIIAMTGGNKDRKPVKKPKK